MFNLVRRLTCSLFITSAFAIAATAAPASAADKLISLGTAGVTGVYYPAGGAICALVNRGRKTHGVRCIVESTGGSIYNLDSLRAGNLNMGIAQSDWLYHAYRGTEIFADQGKNPNLRVLFALHSEPFTIVAGKDTAIKNFDDLRGKRVNIGNTGSGMRATMEELMKFKGWTNKTFDVQEMMPAEQGLALCKKKIDAMIYAAGHPNGAVQQVTMLCGAKLVDMSGEDITNFLKDHPFYSYATIPANMYKNNPNDVKTFGVRAVLTTTKDMDDDTAYEIVKAVFDNLDNFKTLHPVFSTLKPEMMVNSARSIAPLHEGAKRYYMEKGLLK